jgi:hypothetical protein
MLKFLGENYYFDIDELEKQVSTEKSSIQAPPIENEDGEFIDEPEQQISITRYETFKNLIDVVLTEREELDEGLGVHGANNLTIPFKIAFNTLLINKIIKTL